MAFHDLRAFIEQVRQHSCLRDVHGAERELEIGAITEVAAGMASPPALLFDRIPGYAPG